MGFLSVLLPWGILLQVLAVLHFIRRRPDTFWLWIIIFFGPPGAFIYILMEVVPDLGSAATVVRRLRTTQADCVSRGDGAAESGGW